jgi:hypothetical protein
MEQIIENISSSSPIGFYDYSSKYHLTIKDVLSFEIGKPYKIFLLERNMFDPSCDTNPINIPILPSHFFRNCYFIEFTRKDGLMGDCKWLFNNQTQNNFEFHICMTTCWYPLKNNRVPIKDEQELFEIDIDFSGKHFTELSIDTHIGWRGPMMLFENMDNCPKIILTRNGYKY